MQMRLQDTRRSTSPSFKTSPPLKSSFFRIAVVFRLIRKTNAGVFVEIWTRRVNAGITRKRYGTLISADVNAEKPNCAPQIQFSI